VRRLRRAAIAAGLTADGAGFAGGDGGGVSSAVELIPARLSSDLCLDDFCAGCLLGGGESLFRRFTELLELRSLLLGRFGDFLPRPPILQ